MNNRHMWLDRVWQAENPGREFRFRPRIPGEYAEHGKLWTAEDAKRLTAMNRQQNDAGAQAYTAVKFVGEYRLRFPLWGYGFTRETIAALTDDDVRAHVTAAGYDPDAALNPSMTAAIETTEAELEAQRPALLRAVDFAWFQANPDRSLRIRFTREHDVPPELAGDVADGVAHLREMNRQGLHCHVIVKRGEPFTYAYRWLKRHKPEQLRAYSEDDLNALFSGETLGRQRGKLSLNPKKGQSQ